MGPADHAESSIARLGCTSLLCAIDNFSVSISFTVSLDVHAILNMGAMRDVCGNNVLGKHRESGIWSVE
jgi:hypothetical protein